MNGGAIGSLKVYLLTASSKDELFSESGNQGNAWRNQQITLDIQQNFQAQVQYFVTLTVQAILRTVKSHFSSRAAKWGIICR